MERICVYGLVIDVYCRSIVGWQVSASMKTDLVLAALNQALCSRSNIEGLIHHSDQGSQYLSIRYSERLAASGIRPSTGTKGDAYDNALAETVIGLYKAEVIRHCAPWTDRAAVEYATLTWLDWFNNRRLLASIGNIPSREKGKECYRMKESGRVA